MAATAEATVEAMELGGTVVVEEATVATSEAALMAPDDKITAPAVMEVTEVRNMVEKQIGAPPVKVNIFLGVGSH